MTPKRKEPLYLKGLNDGDEKPLLRGRWFHSLKDGQIYEQGQVLNSPEPGWYLCELYGWGSGGPIYQRLYPFSVMTDWLFYTTNEEFLRSADEGEARHGGPYRPLLDVDKRTGWTPPKRVPCPEPD